MRCVWVVCFAVGLPLVSACGAGASSPASAPVAAALAVPEARQSERSQTEAPHYPGKRLPGDVTPTRYALRLELDAERDSLAGTVRIDATAHDAVQTIWLNARGLEVQRATVETGGREHAATTVMVLGDEMMGLTLPEPVRPGALRIEIEYTAPVSSSDLLGVFRQKDRDAHYLYTQFESHHARRAVPCFDEPGWKTPWQLTVRVPAEQKAFSNTPARSDLVADGTREVVFAETKPIPSYLLAFAAGPFEVVDAGTAGRNQTPLRIIVPKGLSEQTAYAVAHTGNVLELLEDYFGRPYPYEKLDSIAVPRFLGAMENPGLITYSRLLLLAEPGAEPEWFQNSYLGISTHEIGHHWFGNLVTLAWWDDLWLNESFTAWVTTKILEQYRPEWNRDVERVETADDALYSDSSAASRPIYVEVPGLPDLFDSLSIVYTKGETVIGMFERWLGPEKFQRGVRAYLTKHAWQNATRNDFLASLAEVSEPAVAEAFSTFIFQPGAPVVTAALECDAGEPPRVVLSQRHFVFAGQRRDDQRLWQIPVCMRHGRGKRASRTCTLFKERETSVPLAGASKCPAWLVANEAGAGYYRVNYSPEQFQGLLFGRNQLSEAERLSVLNDMNAGLVAGTRGVAATFSTVERLANDKSPSIALRAARVVAAAEFLVDEEMRPAYERFIRKTFGKRARKLGWKTRAGDSKQTVRLRERLLRLMMQEGADPAMQRRAIRVVNQWLDTPTSVDPNIITPALRSVGRTGDRAMYDRLLDAARSESDARRKRRLIETLALFSAPELIKRNLELFASGAFAPSMGDALLWSPLGNPRVAHIVWDFTRANLDQVMDRLPGISRSSVGLTASRICDQDGLDDARRILDPLYPPGADGRRDYQLMLESIGTCIARRATQQRAFAEFLAQY